MALTPQERKNRKASGQTYDRRKGRWVSEKERQNEEISEQIAFGIMVVTVICIFIWMLSAL